MTIQATDIKMYKSQNISNSAATNGGRRSANEVVSGVNNNIFPDLSQAERVAGLTSMRKVFCKNTHSAGDILNNARLFIENYTQGDDAVVFHVGDHTGMESALTGTEKLYGCGKLDADVSAGATAINVLIENSAIQFFANGDVIRISDKATIGATGNEEFITVSTVSYAGSVATVNLTTPLANAYLATAARVANVYAAGDVSATVGTPVVATVDNGDFSAGAGANLFGSNPGTIADTFTLTFTGATAFTCSGVYSGSLGTGNTLSDFAPVNPENGYPYFTLKAAGFSGIWGIGDTLTFSTVPSDVAIWCKRVVPAGATAISGNKFVIGIDGETA